MSEGRAVTASRIRNGFFLGFGAALIWGSYLAYSRLGITQGLEPEDLAMLRFGIAGVIMLPYLMMHGIRTLGGVGWWRALALTACAGPVFMLLMGTAYYYAPLPHGAVVPPSSMTVMTMLLAALVLGERPSATRVFGVGIVIVGLGFVAGGGAAGAAKSTAWIGDLLFVLCGTLWAVFTVLQRRWGIKPMPATAALSVLSLVLLLPPYLMFSSFDRILALPTASLVAQIIIQGGLAGIVAVAAFAGAVLYLGASRASLFPALVPGMAILVGIPLTGEWPNALQWIGIAIVTIGLMASMGVHTLRLRRRGATLPEAKG